MRRIPLLLLAAIFSAGSLHAQAPAPGAEARPQAHRGHGDLQALGLSEDQKEKLREIRKQYPDDPQARRKAAAEVLTPEQREKLKELRRQRREMRRAPQAPPPQP